MGIFHTTNRLLTSKPWLGPVFVAFCSVASFAVAGGQQPAAPPVLSELSKLKVQALMKDLEIAQLKAQSAQRDFDQARAGLASLATTLQIEGYDLDLQTLSYRERPKTGPDGSR